MKCTALEVKLKVFGGMEVTVLIGKTRVECISTECHSGKNDTEVIMLATRLVRSCGYAIPDEIRVARPKQCKRHMFALPTSPTKQQCFKCGAVEP